MFTLKYELGKPKCTLKCFRGVMTIHVVVAERNMVMRSCEEQVPLKFLAKGEVACL
jgi:hypothetical protein